MSDPVGPDAEPTINDPDAVPAEPEVNLEAETLRRELEAVQGELETTRGTLDATVTERDGLRLTQLKAEVARENGLPPGVLAGNDRTELEAHADALKEWGRTQWRGRPPRHNAPGSGSRGFNLPDSTDIREIAAGLVRQGPR